MSRPRTALALALGCSVLAACATTPAGWPGLPAEGFQWTEQSLEVTAKGKAPPGISNQTQRRAVSREAAWVEAKGRLKAYLETIQVSTYGTVGWLAARHSVWAARLDRVLSDAAIVRTDWGEDDSAVVTVDLSRSSLESLKAN